MIEIKEGKVFVDGVPTTDPAFIGCVLLDFAESNESVIILNIDELEE